MQESGEKATDILNRRKIHRELCTRELNGGFKTTPITSRVSSVFQSASPNGVAVCLSVISEAKASFECNLSLLESIELPKRRGSAARRIQVKVKSAELLKIAVICLNYSAAEVFFLS